eukprot:11090-Pyramimonas_sp.AAC.1
MTRGEGPHLEQLGVERVGTLGCRVQLALQEAGLARQHLHLHAHGINQITPALFYGSCVSAPPPARPRYQIYEHTSRAHVTAPHLRPRAPRGRLSENLTGEDLPGASREPPG